MLVYVPAVRMHYAVTKKCSKSKLSYYKILQIMVFHTLCILRHEARVVVTFYFLSL